MAAAHYIEALRLQAKAARMHAIFGGKNPHLQSLVVGGITCVADLNPERITEFFYVWKETQEFIKDVYIPDLLAVASFYKDWGAIGGTTNFLAWGDLPLGDKEPDDLFLPRGVIMKRDLKGIKMADQAKVTEHVAHSWYEAGSPKHPWEGETRPQHGDYQPEGKYSWFKSPRYDGEPCEVGPLARVLVAYARGKKEVNSLVDDTLKKLGVPVEALFSTLGRTAARGLETLVIGNAMEGWINDLIGHIKGGDIKTYQHWEMPEGTAIGCGLNDVARGALGHWIKIKDKKIENYQMVVPSTWNLCPRDEKGKMGPVEEALIGTPVADPKQAPGDPADRSFL